MMRLNKFFTVGILSLVFFVACKSDDDEPLIIIPERDRGEQAVKDNEALLDYLQTHFYNYEEFQNPAGDFDYKIRFDTISGENSEKTPIIESPFLEEKTVTVEDVEYTIYILKLREGAGEHPTFGDSTFVTYRGELLNRVPFDSAITPVWFDLAATTQGFVEGITEFGGSSGFVVNPDNTIDWNDDYGIGAVFVPSGLAYYAEPPTGSIVPQYAPLVFGFELYGVNESDHDHDGIPSYMEDYDEDGTLYQDLNDDTDADLNLNYLDDDDDEDGILTIDEIVINEDGSLTFPDTDGDGTPDYLDAE